MTTKFLARDHLLPPRRVAEVTGLDRRAVKYLLDSGRLPYVVDGQGRRTRRVWKSAVLRYLAERQESRP